MAGTSWMRVTENQAQWRGIVEVMSNIDYKVDDDNDQVVNFSNN